jgi:hypothetical protein
LTADRYEDDFDIAMFVRDLRRQIQENGGTLTTILGNHDHEGVNFITNGLGGNLKQIHKQSIRGIFELGRFLELAPSTLDIDQFFAARKADTDYLKRLRESEEGQALCELYGDMKLFHRIDGVVFQHTPPTPSTLNAINYPHLNEEHRDAMSKVLQGEKPFAEEYHRIGWLAGVQAITCADNRRAATPLETNCIWDEVVENGVRTFVFGHDRNSAGLRTIQTNLGPVTLLGCDHKFCSSADHTFDPHALRSVAMFYPDGTVETEINAFSNLR